MVSASDNSWFGPLKVMYLKGNESQKMDVRITLTQECR